MRLTNNSQYFPSRFRLIFIYCLFTGLMLHVGLQIQSFSRESHCWHMLADVFGLFLEPYRREI